MTGYEAISVEPITTHPFEDFQAAHEAGMALLPQDQPVASLHRPVARLTVDPELLQIATRELEQGYDTQLAFVDQHSNDQLQSNARFPLRNAAALRELVAEGDRVFRRVIEAELGPAERRLTTVTVGPYDPRSIDERWHRDFGWYVQDRKAVTYAAELIGEPTTVSTAQHRESDFLDNNVRAGHMPRPSRHHQYAPGTVVAIDGTLGVYRTPGEDYRGQPWLSFRSFVIGALAVKE